MADPNNQNHHEDEFSSFTFAVDKVLINPNTKKGRYLYEEQSKCTIKDADRLKGKGSEGETFRRYLKALQTRGNFTDVLTFIDATGKKHDLANAPEVTSIDELVAHNNHNTWNYKNEVANDGEIVKLSDKDKTDDDDKQVLREIIDRRAKNQIVRVYLNKILDPDLYSMIVGKVSNWPALNRKDEDNNDDIVIDGTVLLLMVSKLICPSTIALIENLKSEAESLNLKDFDHDVSAVVNKFEEIVARINANGRKWDDEITALFKVLETNEDSQFNTAIQIKESEHSAGTLTKLSELTSFVTAIYTNQKAKNKWMVPDAKSAKIAALMSKVQTLESSISRSAFTADSSSSSTSDTNTRSFKSNCAPWRYVHQGDKVTRDGKDWYWCDHPSHKRDGACTDGMYCCTHGKGHPEHDHASWIEWKKANPFGKRKKKDESSSSSSSQSAPSSGISLSDKLKSALLTKTACTESDLAALSRQDF